MNYETEKNIPISQWNEEDKPREKLMNKGKNALSDAELLAIIINSGTLQESALDIARKILNTVDNNLNELGRLDLQSLQQFRGIGTARAVTIAAALELGRRRQAALPITKPKINTVAEAAQLLTPLLADLPHEEFYVVLLKRNNELIKIVKLSAGGVAGTVVDNKILFKIALENLASNIILAHNHPSGNMKPSDADIQITKNIKAAANLLDIQLADHLIISKNGYYSFANDYDKF
jgi:DNA repair protein RadC